jgi:hypothetical protein
MWSRPALFRRWHQQIAVGDHSGDNAAAAHGGDYLVEVRVQHRFATGKRDDAGAQVRQQVNPADHHILRHGRRKIVVFVAVCAG